MIGTVNSALEAMIRIVVDDSDGRAHDVDALIDTGFNGFLTLPSKHVAAMALPWLFRQQAQLADGSIEVFDVHEATVVWDDSPRMVEIEAVDAVPLIGMSLLQGHSLHVDIIENGRVRIDLLR